jgi:hypothetical protein
MWHYRISLLPNNSNCPNKISFVLFCFVSLKNMATLVLKKAQEMLEAISEFSNHLL